MKEKECTGPFSDAFDCPVHDPRKRQPVPAVGASLPQEITAVEGIYVMAEELRRIKKSLLALHTEMDQSWQSRTFVEALTVKDWASRLGHLLTTQEGQ